MSEEQTKELVRIVHGLADYLELLGRRIGGNDCCPLCHRVMRGGEWGYGYEGHEPECIFERAEKLREAVSPYWEEAVGAAS